MSDIFDINEALRSLGLNPTTLHDSVLESTFRNKTFAPLGYFPNESLGQLRARYFTPFKAVVKQPRIETFVDMVSGETRSVKRGVSISYERDFEGMDAAAAAVLALEQRAEQQRIEKIKAEERTKKLEAEVSAQKAQLESLRRALAQSAANQRVKDHVRQVKRVPDEEQQKMRDKLQCEQQLREQQLREQQLREQQLREQQSEQLRREQHQRDYDNRCAKAVLSAKAAAERIERERLAKIEQDEALAREQEERARIARAKEVKAQKEAAAARARAQKKQEEEEAALLDAACKENISRQQEEKFRQKADKDMANLKSPLRILRLDNSVPSIPHHLAVFTMVFCIGMREKLMLNIISRFSAWSVAAKIPGFSVLRQLFKEHLVINEREAVMPPPLYNNSGIQTRGIQLVIQCMRNIMGVVLDLRCLIQPTAVDSTINTCSLYHSRFLMLANVCKIRQMSLVILDAMDLLATKEAPRPSAELLALYESVAMFEQFVQGSDFTVFRQAFVLPTLPKLPESMFPSEALRVRVEDCVLAHGLKVEEFAMWELDSKRASFLKYKEDCKPLFSITLALWKSQVMKPVSGWLKHVDAATVDKFRTNPQFIELLPMWFGITDIKTWKYEPFFDLDPFVEGMKTNAKSMGADLSHQLINLAFLLSDAPHKFASSFSPMPKMVFPFHVTLKDKWEALCAIHTDKNDMLMLNAHLLELADKLGLE
jgi:hypothetical protein